MGKWVSSEVLDGALAVVAGADMMVAISGQPRDFAEAVSGALASVPMSPLDYMLRDGVESGRRITVATKNAVPVQFGGNADHVALLHMASKRLIYVTTCPGGQLDAGGTVNFEQWDVEIGAPA